MKNAGFLLVCLFVFGCTKVQENGKPADNTPQSLGVEQVVTPNEASIGETESKNEQQRSKQTLTSESNVERADLLAGAGTIPESAALKGATLSDILYENSPIGQLFQKTAKKSETVTFLPSATENITVKAKEGTVFTIAPHSFLDENGNPVVKPITLEVKECYKMADILFTNLTTTCGELPIETAGMIYLDATSEGKRVMLDKTHPILVEMPTNKPKKEKMQWFSGEKLPVSGVTNWKIAPRETNLNVANDKTKVYGMPTENYRDYLKCFDLGSVEVEFTVTTDPLDIMQQPEMRIRVSDMNPLLKKYQQGIEQALRSVSWTDKVFDPVSSTFLAGAWNGEYGLGKPIFVQKEQILKLKEEMKIYKNVTIKKTLPIVARMNKDYYYVRTGLGNTFTFNLLAWKSDMDLFTGNFQVLKEKGDDYLSAMAEAFQINKDKLVESTELQYANSYIFAMNQLGWGNCDQFFPLPNTITPLVVQCDNPEATDFKIIFKNRGVVLPAIRMKTGRLFAFNTVPMQEEVMIVGTKSVNGNPQFCFKEIITGKETSIEMNDFHAVTFGELQEKMDRYQVF